MHYLFFAIITTFSINCMEQTKTAPSLTKLSLISLAHRVKKEFDKNLLENEKERLFTIFDTLKSLNLLKEFEKITEQFITATISEKPFPDAISFDGSKAYYKDPVSNKDYLGTLDNPKKLLLPHNHITSVITSVIFSPDNRLAIGWNIDKKLYYIDTNTGTISPCKTETDDPIRCETDYFFTPSNPFNYCFLPNNTLIFINKKALYRCSPDDLIIDGKKERFSLIYTRSDNENYPQNLHNNSIHAISNSLICYGGPHGESIHIIKEKDSKWDLLRTINVPMIIDSSHAQFLPIIALQEWRTRYQISFYNLGKMETENDPIETGSFNISTKLDFMPKFSQDGTLCAYVAKSNVTVINCIDVKKPFVSSTVSIPTIYLSTIFWHNKTIYTDDTDRYYRNEIPLSMLKLIDEYKKHKKGQKEPDSNNNNTAITDSL